MKNKVTSYRYKGFKLKLIDTDDSFWVSFENGTDLDCTDRFNDEVSAIDSAKEMIDRFIDRF